MTTKELIEKLEAVDPNMEWVSILISEEAIEEELAERHYQAVNKDVRGLTGLMDVYFADLYFSVLDEMLENTISSADFELEELTEPAAPANHV